MRAFAVRRFGVHDARRVRNRPSRHDPVNVDGARAPLVASDEPREEANLAK
jgi:hypothetical protein